MESEHFTIRTMSPDSEIRKLQQELKQEDKEIKLIQLRRQVQAAKRRNRQAEEAERQFELQQRRTRAQHNLDLLNTPSVFRFLADRSTYATIFDIIFDDLENADVIRLCRTCRLCSNIYKESISRKWNVDKCLSRFVTHPKDFRYNLGLNQALIIGDVPLQFFSRLTWKESSLDILVEGVHKSAIEDCLRAQDYTAIDGSERTLPIRLFDFNITDWSKKDASETVRKIRLFATSDAPIRSFLYSLTLSTASAIITWDTAFFLFPNLHFLQNKLGYSANDYPNLYSSNTERYDHVGLHANERALRRINDHKAAVYGSLKLRDNTRRVGDPYTWTLPLDCCGIPEIEFGREFFEKATYQAEDLTCPLEFYIRAESVKSCMLRHTYTCPGYTMSYMHTWYNYMRWTLCKLATQQICIHGMVGDLGLGSARDEDVLHMLMRAKRVPDSHEPFCPLLDSFAKAGIKFVPPADWEYADHLIPKIYEEWLKYEDDVEDDGSYA